MPNAIAPRCRYYPRCPHSQPCPDHGRRSPYQDVRGTTDERGYTRRWKDYTAWFKRQRNCSLCGRNHVECEECAKQGIIRLTDVVDHKKPHRRDRSLFWLHSNHQGLCTDCHNRKSGTEVLDR
jgi:5-methylcytosine-specific restriction protein A